MRKSFGILAVLAVTACSTTSNPPPLPQPDTGTDVPDNGPGPMDVFDAGDTPVAPDVPVTPDVPPPDLMPVDVPPGTPFCDMPATAESEVRGAVLPTGFCVRKFTPPTTPTRRGVQHPRVIAFAPNGDLFVASPLSTGPGGTGPGFGEIVVLPDDNRDGFADQTITYLNRARLSELDTVHGLLFHGGYLYFTTFHGVWRVPYRNGDRTAPAGMPEQVANLSESERWTHTLAVRPDGRMYVSMGIYGSSQCPYPAPYKGAILEIGPNHSMVGGRVTMGSVVARGFRNPMYIRCQPWGSCYAAELTDDGWSLPGQEKLVIFDNNQDYGYPCCYDRNLVSPAGRSVGMTDMSCANITASSTGWVVGYTPFGHDFAPGRWPAPHGHGLFVGMHGRVGSWEFTGINWAPADATTHQFMRETQVFLGGWGMGTMNPGRVADLAFAPDGRMFFTDDQQGYVYWIAPTGLQRP